MSLLKKSSLLPFKTLNFSLLLMLTAAAAIAVELDSKESLPNQSGALLAAGSHHSFFAYGDELWARGENQIGQCGDGTTQDIRAPRKILFGRLVKQIVAGAHHTLVLTNDGEVYAWGDNAAGQLGDGFRISRASAIRVAMSKQKNFKQIAAGARHSLALSVEGEVFDLNQNKIVSFPEEIALIGAGNDLSLAASKAGTVWIWRNNDSPAVVMNLEKPIRQMEAGGDFILVLTQDGDVWQLNRSEKMLLRFFLHNKITQIATGSMHRVALSEQGQVFVWGDNTYGQLGPAAYWQASRTEPILVPTKGAVTQIAANGYYTLALTSKEGAWEIYAWGFDAFKNNPEAPFKFCKPKVEDAKKSCILL